LATDDFQTAQQVFSELNDRLRADPQKVAGTNAAYLFDLTGDGGGPYHIVLQDGSGEAGPGAVENPNVTFTMSAGDLVGLRTGKLDGTMAFMSGKLKIKGDMGLAMKLQTFFG